MTKFPQSEYYLIKILRKVPFPMLTWSCLIAVINFIASYKIILGLEHVARFEFIRFYLGNTFFSILALLLIVILYEQSIKTINEWIKEKDILGKKEKIIDKLNASHNYFFGRFQFLLIGIGIIVRYLLAKIICQETPILGRDVIDTIAMFLILSFFFTCMGVIYCLYNAGLNGVKVKYPFEIREAYKDFVSLSVNTALKVGIYMGAYSAAIVVWAYQTEQYILGAIIDALIITGIFIVFFVGTAGIQKGIARSKQDMLYKIKLEMDKFQQVYAHLMDSMKSASLNKLYEVIMILESFSKRCKNIEEVNEWIFDVRSLTKIILMSIATFIISLLIALLNIITTHPPP